MVADVGPVVADGGPVVEVEVAVAAGPVARPTLPVQQETHLGVTAATTLLSGSGVRSSRTWVAQKPTKSGPTAILSIIDGNNKRVAAPRVVFLAPWRWAPLKQLHRHQLRVLLAAFATAITRDANLREQLYHARSSAHAYEVLHADEAEDLNYFLDDAMQQAGIGQPEPLADR